MFNNFVVVLASLLLDPSIEFEWYENSWSLLFYYREYMTWTKFSNYGYKI
jgi:hypothetical protein